MTPLPTTPSPTSTTTDPASFDLPPGDRWRAWLVSVAGWMFDFYDLVLFAYLAKAISRDWQWGADFHHHKALVVGAALGTSGLGGIVFGGLADRYGRKRVMMWTIVVYSLGTGLCGFADGLWSLVALRALVGFGVGGEWATGHALMAEIFPKERRGLASALLQAGEPVGVGLAILAGLWLEPRVGWRAVFWLSALPALLVLAVRRHVPESPRWLAHGPKDSFWQPYRELFSQHRKAAAQAWLLGASKLGTYWLTYVWLPEYFAEQEQHHAGSSFSAIRIPFLLVAQGGQLAGMLVFGVAADRFGRRPAFTAYSLLTAAGLVVLARYGPTLLLHPEVFWPAMAAVGFGSGCTAGFGALLAEHFPTRIRNTAMGTVYNLARSFQFFTQFAMAYIAVHAGVGQGLMLAAGFALVTASWVWTFPERRGEALRDH